MNLNIENERLQEVQKKGDQKNMESDVKHAGFQGEASLATENKRGYYSVTTTLDAQYIKEQGRVKR